MSKRSYSESRQQTYTHSIEMDVTQEYLKATRSGNLDKLLKILNNEDVDINATNANGLGGIHLAAKEGHSLVVLELVKRGANVEAQTKRCYQERTHSTRVKISKVTQNLLITATSAAEKETYNDANPFIKRQPRGYTALHIASLSGQVDIVRLLLESGSRINTQSQTGFTPLYMAAQENHPNVVQLLLENYADQAISTQDGYTPLTVALQLGHEEVVNLLMEFDTARGTTTTPGGQGTLGKGTRLPALHAAAKKDDVPSAELLLRNAQNADSTGRAVGNLVNDITKGGFTSLHIAAHYGNVRVARLLLDYGADIDFKARNSITPLHVASKWGRTNMVQFLLDNGARIDAPTRDELSPLHCAARSGHDQSVSALLSYRAPISARTKNGLAPLHMSAQGDHLESSRLLLRGGANIEDVTVDYLTPLHVTAHCGSVKACKLLLENKCDVDARALNGFTSLHVACKKNRIPIIELLLRFGATLEATTETGMTPLHVASFLGHKPIVELLLKEGADPNKKTSRGETSLHLATRGDQNEVMATLLSNGAEVDAQANELQTALHIAARQGNLDNVELLLKHGASPNATTKDLYTPLHIAAREGHLEVAKVLLEDGADQTLTTKKGFTPLHIAAKQGHKPMTKLLLDQGGDVNVKGRNELTPLHVATHYGHGDVAMYLLDRGADPECQAKNGYTPLHITAKRNLVDIGKNLLKRGAKPNAESKNGFTPLHLATKEGHVPMVTELLENKANPNSRAKNGLTPMHLAAQEDHVPAAEILEQHGAEIDPQTKAGYTPLHTACHFGQINMIQFLLRHGAQVNARTKAGHTPLHQAAQQGHVMALNLLLKWKADPNALTNDGHTGLSIAEQQGYLSVVEMLSGITDVIPIARPGKYKPLYPETMKEASMMDIDRPDSGALGTIDESEVEPMSATWPRSKGLKFPSDKSSAMDDSELTPPDGDQSMQPWSASGTLPSGVNGRSPYKDDGDLFGDRTSERYSRITPAMERQALEDELQYMREPVTLSEDFMPDRQGSSGTMKIPRAAQLTRSTPEPEGPVGCDLCQMEAAQAQGKFPPRGAELMPPNAGLATSFIAGPEGAVGRGCPHMGVKVVVPPDSVNQPIRISCRLVEAEKLSNPPTLMDGEALASRIVEMGPPGAHFNRPVLIEVPHFASLRGNERETTVLASEDGRNWREHATSSNEQDAVNVIRASVNEPDRGVFHKNRVTRIVTTDFPRYFAIVTRLHEDKVAITPSGGYVSSANQPNIVAAYPPGALTKNTKLGLQVQPVPDDLVKKKLGPKVSFSPIVSLEPRRRRFHKPITLTMPAPPAKSSLKKKGEPPSLRLLCSVSEDSPAQLEDITDTTPLTVSNDLVSFNTPLSAKFWLVDCPNIDDSEKLAEQLYPEVTRVPFMAKFVVFARRHHPHAARLRVFCVLDDNVEHLFKNQGKFVEIARSQDVEVLNESPQYLEWDGNLYPLSRSRKQHSVYFKAFKVNRASFVVRIRDPSKEPRAKLLCMRDPKSQGQGQSPICELDVKLPLVVSREKPNEIDEEDAMGEEAINLDELLPEDYNMNGNDLEDPLEELVMAQSAPVAASTPRKKDTQQLTPYDEPELKYEPASMSIGNVQYATPEYKPKEESKELVRKPQITHKTVEGEIQSKSTIQEDNQSLPDGRSVRRKVITTKHIKPVTELTMKDDKVIDSKVTGIHVGTDIEEHILELPSGVIEANAANCDTAITVENSEVPLPDGVVAKKKLVRMIVSLKPGSKVPADKAPSEPVVKEPLLKVIEDDVIAKESVSEREEKLPDGRTLRYKEIRTDYVKPITEQKILDGKVVDSKIREEITDVKIDENILELPVGLIEPNALNCDTDIDVSTSKVPLPEGIEAKKTTTRMTLKIRDPEDNVDSGAPDAKMSKPQGQKSQPSSPPVALFRKRGSLADSKGPGKKRKDEAPLPEGGSRIVEGEIEYRTDTKENQQVRNDGTTLRYKTITSKHIKPIFRITRHDGADHKTLLREDPVGADIVENVLELPPGVHEPNAENLTSKSTVQNVEETLPGGIAAKKKIVRTVVSFKDIPSSMTSHAAGRLLPTITHNTVEGAPEDRATEAEDSDSLPDGTAICKKEITTRRVIPITDVIIANGRAPESSEREKLLDVDVAENVLILPCGIIKPHAQNCQSDIVVKKSKSMSPDGTEINRKLVKVDVQLKHPPITHKVIDGKPFSKQEVVENNQNLPDGRLSRQKVVTTKHIQPVTEVQLVDGRVTETRPREEVTGVDIDENILELPVGVIEPYAENCDTNVTVDASQVQLPEGIKAKKITVKTAVTLKDEQPIEAAASPQSYSARPSGQPLSNLQNQLGTVGAPGTKDTPGTPKGSKKAPVDTSPLKEGETRIVEGEIEYRKESKNNEYRNRDGGIVRTKTDTTTHILPIYQVTRVGGVDRKKQIKEEIVGADIVENILELPPGIAEPNGENLQSHSTLQNTEQLLPGGIVAAKKIVKTTVTKVNPHMPIGSPVTRTPTGEQKPLISKKLLEGSPKVKPDETESMEKLPGGTALVKKKVTLAHCIPVTEVTLENFAPPDSCEWDKVVGGDVVEATLRLPSGTIEPNGENCKTNLVVDQKPDDEKTLNDKPVTVKVVDMNVQLDPPSHSQLKTHKIREGETKAKSDVVEDEKYLDDGSTVKQKIITTKYFKPITDDTLLEGKVVDSHSWEEIVEADIDENILTLPAGVIEPNASNVDVDIQVQTSETPIPEGILAKKTLVKINAKLKDDNKPAGKGSSPGKEKSSQPDEEKLKEKVKSLPQASHPNNIQDPASKVIEGPIEPRTSSSEEQKTNPDGAVVRSKIVTTRNVRPFFKVGKINGIEYKALIREEIRDIEIVENILQIPKGVEEPFGKNVKVDTTVNLNDERSPDGVPIKRKTLTSVAKPMVDEPYAYSAYNQPAQSPSKRLSYAGEEEPNVKVFEGEIEPRQTVVEDREDLDDGSTILRKEVTTRLVKPVTEVKLIPGHPPDSVTRDVVIGADLKEVILHLPAGVLEPNAANCEADISVKKSNTVLPDGTPAKKKLVQMVVKLKEPEITHTVVEGDIVSKTEVQEDEKNLRDGSTLRTKVMTTKNWKPVTDIILTNGIFTSEKTEEKLVSVEVEENLIRLPVGVIEPHAANCDAEITVNNSEFTAEGGVPGKKKSVKMLVKLKGQPSDKANQVFEDAIKDLALSPYETSTSKTPGRVEEGALVFRTETDSDEKILDDGTTVRTKRAITRHIKPTIKIALVDGVEKKTLLREEVVGATIEETVLELPPGVTDPDGYKVDTTMKALQERLPDGTLAKKKLVHSVVLLPGQTAATRPEAKLRATPTRETKAEPMGTGTKIIDGDIESRSTTEEDCKNLPNGRTLKRKIVTTRFVKPVTEIQFLKGVPIQTRKKEEIVGAEVEENILELPAGVLEPMAKNCDTIITVDNSDVTLPDGLPAKKRVVKMDVRLKAPSKDSRIIEGEIIPRVDVKEDQQIFDDGSTCRRKLITTKFMKPITEVMLVNGNEAGSSEREELVGMEIEEVTLKMPAGVIEPYGSNLDTKTTVDQFDVAMPDGIIAKKKIVHIDVKLKQPDTPEVVHKQVKGELTSESDVRNDDQTLPDGTRVRRKTVTTRHFIPITDVTVVNGKETEKKVRKEPAGVEVEETILKLCPGVTSPDAPNTLKETREKNIQDVLPDGSLAKKKIIKTVVKLKEEKKAPVEEPIMAMKVAPKVRSLASVKEGGSEDEEGFMSEETTLTTTKFYEQRNAPPVMKKKVKEEDEEGFMDEETTITTRRPYEIHYERTSGHREEPEDELDFREDTTITTKKPPAFKRTIKTRIRKIGPDGNITEENFMEEEDLSNPSSPTDREPTSPFLLQLTGQDSDTESSTGIKIFTDTKESEPVVDRQVQEYEDMLPDGTMVRRKVIKKTEKRTITKRIIMEGPEQELLASADAKAQEILRRGFGDSSLTKYTDSKKFEPEPQVDVEEFEEMLSDGRVMKTRVQTTTQQQLTTERQLMSGPLNELPCSDILYGSK